ncbi:amidase [Chelativorans sp. YIM 93263]|uniref:amidase n=1 Tax=Chelativorans sp. YIM 93263 TaxID=2906648 RepID=UPI002378C3BC|nr:amidase [Chelativorans sp. YIM 93263]
MTTTRGPLNAFLDYPESSVPSAPNGALAGLRLAVKDMYDIAGYPTGGGNPQKEAESGIAETTAPAIQVLLDAGASFLGKTQTEELTFSIIGMNAHFPAPVNPRARERVTGGSSSGSAAAVAGGLADIGIGSDTNGSIRAPASFCGLLGLRTTFGRISMEGAMPLAPSFDTLGWFARDPLVYDKVAELLLGADTHGDELSRPVRISELEGYLFGEAERAAYGDMLEKVGAHFDGIMGFLALPGAPEELFDAFKQIQAYEAWQTHRAFLSSKERNLGPGVKERLDYARSLTNETVEEARSRRQRFQEEFAALFDPKTIMVTPSQPSAAPLKMSTQAELQSYRDLSLTMNSIAGLLGWPQISIPLGEVHGAPFGISLLGPAGSDRQLIHLASKILSGT